MIPIYSSATASWCSLSNIFTPAAWPQMMKKHFICAWNPWITGGVQDLVYSWTTARRKKTVSSWTAVPCVPILDTWQAGHGRITSWASAILDASHYCLLLTLTRLRVNRMCLMKLLAPFIHEKVAYWIYSLMLRPVLGLGSRSVGARYWREV